MDHLKRLPTFREESKLKFLRQSEGEQHEEHGFETKREVKQSRNNNTRLS